MRIKNRVRARPEPMAPKIEFADRFALADCVAACRADLRCARNLPPSSTARLFCRLGVSDVLSDLLARLAVGDTDFSINLIASSLIPSRPLCCFEVALKRCGRPIRLAAWSRNFQLPTDSGEGI
jgi:hypothetical protein